MNKTFLPKSGLGAADIGEGSIFSELHWWQQGLMRQGLESGSLSDLTPQGLAGAEAKGTATLLGPPEPGYPGVAKTISVPRPYVAFKRLGRTLALGKAFLVYDERAGKQQRESHMRGGFLLSSPHCVCCFFNSVGLILLNCKRNRLPRKSLVHLSILINVMSVLRVSKLSIKCQIVNIFCFVGLMISRTKVYLCLSSVEITIFNNM